MVVDRLWVAADQVRVPAQVPDCYPAEEEWGPDPDRMGRTEQLAAALVCLFPLSSSSVLFGWLNEWTDQRQLLFRVWLDTRGRVTKSALQVVNTLLNQIEGRCSNSDRRDKFCPRVPFASHIVKANISQ
jgi:hypothetical protein